MFPAPRLTLLEYACKVGQRCRLALLTSNVWAGQRRKCNSRTKHSVVCMFTDAMVKWPGNVVRHSDSQVCLPEYVCRQLGHIGFMSRAEHSPQYILSTLSTDMKDILMLCLLLLMLITGCHAHSPRIAAIIARAHRGASSRTRNSSRVCS